jgi:hypothetical protein
VPGTPILLVQKQLDGSTTRTEGLEAIQATISTGSCLCLRDQNGVHICGGPIMVVTGSRFPKDAYVGGIDWPPLYLVMRVEHIWRDQLYYAWRLISWEDVSYIFQDLRLTFPMYMTEFLGL